MTFLMISLPLSIGAVWFAIIAVSAHEMTNPPEKVAPPDEGGH